MVFDILIVRVKEGREEEFQQTRDELITIAHNTNLVNAVYKFDVNRDVFADPRSIFPEEVENIELTLIVYPSKAARNKYRDQLRDSPDFKAYLETFECKMCALMVENRRPEFFPPFD